MIGPRGGRANGRDRPGDGTAVRVPGRGDGVGERQRGVRCRGTTMLYLRRSCDGRRRIVCLCRRPESVRASSPLVGAGGVARRGRVAWVGGKAARERRFIDFACRLRRPP